METGRYRRSSGIEQNRPTMKSTESGKPFALKMQDRTAGSIYVRLGIESSMIGNAGRRFRNSLMVSKTSMKS